MSRPVTSFEPGRAVYERFMISEYHAEWDQLTEGTRRRWTEAARAGNQSAPTHEEPVAWRWRSTLFAEWNLTDKPPIDQLSMERETGLNMDGLTWEALYAAPTPPSHMQVPTAKMLLAGSMVDWKKYDDKAEAALDVWNVMLRNAPAPVPNAVESFQSRVEPWLLACFGQMIAGDREERNHRFLEEALELVQSLGCTAHEAHQLVDYVYGRAIGEPDQEVGGTMVTLAALCWANDLDMHQAGETELARIWTKVEQIRAKQAAKPKHSPLPGPSPQPMEEGR